MKPMFASGYHQSGFVATHALVHMMYGYTLLVLMNQRMLKRISKKSRIGGRK